LSDQPSSRPEMPRRRKPNLEHVRLRQYRVMSERLKRRGLIWAWLFQRPWVAAPVGGHAEGQGHDSVFPRDHSVPAKGSPLPAPGPTFLVLDLAVLSQGFKKILENFKEIGSFSLALTHDNVK